MFGGYLINTYLCSMDTLKLNQLIKDFPMEEIERHIVHYYIMSNKIDFTANRFLCQYLDGFQPNAKIQKEVSTIGILTIEEMANAMELLIPSADKKVNGAFFTPPYIADYILKTISPSYDAKIIDLSCGSGAFLLAIVRYYVATYKKNISDCIKENVYGADTNDTSG